MIFLTKLKEKIIGVLELFKGFSLIPRLKSVNRRVLIIGLGAMLTLVLLLLIIVMVSRLGGGTSETPAQLMSLDFTIPLEDLFMPSEPDFIPELLFEQEPRSFWSIEDIRPFWRNPENSAGITDSDIWRDEIRSTVDRLLEGVP